MSLKNENLVNVVEYINMALDKCYQSLFTYKVEIFEDLNNGIIDNITIIIEKE